MTKSTGAAPPHARQAELPERKPPGLAGLVVCLGGLLLSSVGLRTLPAQEAAPRIAVNLQVIVVDSESKAQEALERLKRGQKFSTVAAQMSIDPNASNGGYVGEADVALLRPELRAVVESLKPEQVSPIVKVPTCSGLSDSTTARNSRSEEHTSELQSRGHLVCPLLLDKK